MQAMKERDDEHPLTGFIQLDDAYWGGVRSGKPGRGAEHNALSDRSAAAGVGTPRLY